MISSVNEYMLVSSISDSQYASHLNTSSFNNCHNSQVHNNIREIMMTVLPAVCYWWCRDDTNQHWYVFPPTSAMNSKIITTRLTF